MVAGTKRRGMNGKQSRRAAVHAEQREEAPGGKPETQTISDVEPMIVDFNGIPYGVADRAILPDHAMSMHHKLKVLSLMWKGILNVVSPPEEDKPVSRETDMRSHLGWSKPLVECHLNSFQFKKERAVDPAYDASCRILETMVREVLADGFQAYIASPESSGTDKLNYLKSQLSDQYAAKPPDVKRNATMKELLEIAGKNGAQIDEKLGEIDATLDVVGTAETEQQRWLEELEHLHEDKTVEDGSELDNLIGLAQNLPSEPETSDGSN